MRKSTRYKEQKKILTDIENFQLLVTRNEKIMHIDNLILCIIRENYEDFRRLVCHSLKSTHEVSKVYVDVFEPKKKMISDAYILKPKENSKYNICIISHKRPYVKGDIVTGGSLVYEEVSLSPPVLRLANINKIFK